MPVKFDVTSLTKFIESLDRHNRNAMRSAARRTNTAMTKAAFSIVSKQYPQVRKDASEGDRPSFRTLTEIKTIHGRNSIRIDIKAIPTKFNAIHNVIGSTKIRDQKGIKVADRPGIYFNIAGTIKRAGKGQFIVSPLHSRHADVTLLTYRGKGLTSKGKPVLLKETFSAAYDLLLYADKAAKIEEAFSKVIDKVYDKYY